MNKRNAIGMLNEIVRLSGAVHTCGECTLFKTCPKETHTITTRRLMGIKDNIIIPKNNLDKKIDIGWKPCKSTVIQYDTEKEPGCEFFTTKP